MPGAKDDAGPMHVVSNFQHHDVLREDEADAEREADVEEWARGVEREMRNVARGRPAGRGVPDSSLSPSASSWSSLSLKLESEFSTSRLRGRGRREPHPALSLIHI